MIWPFSLFDIRLKWTGNIAGLAIIVVRGRMLQVLLVFVLLELELLP